MRHIFVSAIAISLLAGSLSPAYAADSRHEKSAHQQRSDRNSYRSQDRRNDGRHERRADGHRDDRYSNDRRSSRDWNGRYSNDSRQYRANGRHDDRRFDRHYRYDRGFHPAHYDRSYRGRFHAGSYYRPHGYRTYSWHRGARLPAAYCAPRYVIRDYGAYHLGYPPRGYHWVRVENDVILAAITTGIVVQVVSDLFY